MVDIDAGLEILTKAIQDALRVAAPKRRPDEDRSHQFRRSFLQEGLAEEGSHNQAQNQSVAEIDRL